MRSSLFRRVTQSAWDFLSWLAAAPLAAILRYDGALPDQALGRALLFGAILGSIQVVLSYSIQLARGRFVIGSFDEISAIALATGITTLIGLLLLLLPEPSFLPRTVPVIGGAIAMGFMLAGRFILRAYRQRAARPREGNRVLIYGAGESGEQIVRQMLVASDSGFMPIGFVDDDATKRNLRIHGVKVLGSGDDLESILHQAMPDVLVIAIGAVTSEQLSDLDRRCSSSGVTLRVIPTTSEILGGAVTLDDIADVTEEDLLGRRPVSTDESSIRGFIAGKRILITGAGGSIGSELARQVHRYQPEFVAHLDRDESALHSLQLSLTGHGLLDSEAFILADIRDVERMHDVLTTLKPDIVFHSAALKHLPLLERYPEEGHKTNVLGTRNVLAAAKESGVSVFVNISTDKAASPTSVLGMTKLQTERMTAEASFRVTGATSSSQRFMSVRFGNVIGSRGSVLTAFRHQISNGGPVTVTDPEVTRFFMTISEAVHLVLQAAVIGRNGDTLILDMGKPVSITDVAQRLIERSGRKIAIVYTGLRPGEKLNEVLVADDETREESMHPLIWRVRQSNGPVL